MVREGGIEIGVGDRIKVLGIASFLTSHPPYILKVLDMERLDEKA